MQQQQWVWGPQGLCRLVAQLGDHRPCPARRGHAVPWVWGQGLGPPDSRDPQGHLVTRGAVASAPRPLRARPAVEGVWAAARALSLSAVLSYSSFPRTSVGENEAAERMLLFLWDKSRPEVTVFAVLCCILFSSLFINGRLRFPFFWNGAGVGREGRASLRGRQAGSRRPAPGPFSRSRVGT